MVNTQYYHAAQIDGANTWQRFLNVTLPQLAPMTFFISIISIINAFKVFDEVYALFNDRPGVANSALTVVYYMYNKFYGEWDFGVASAAALVLFIIIFIFTMIQMYIGSKRVTY